MSSQVQKWYSFLTPGPPEASGAVRLALMDVERPTKDNLVVCLQKEYRKYTLFQTWLDFGRFLYREMEPEARCFFEIVYGLDPQKIYFDLEAVITDELDHVPVRQSAPTQSSETPSRPAMVPLTVLRSRNPDELPTLRPLQGKNAPEAKFCLSRSEGMLAVQAVIAAVRKLIPQIDAEDDTQRGQILVFESYSKSKLSFHIVVDEWCVENHLENRAFCDKVLELLPRAYRRIVDPLYSSTQQFRIVDCHKWQDSRIKTLSKLSVGPRGQGWTPRTEALSEDHGRMMILGASLVSNVSYCHLLPRYRPVTPPRMQRQYSGDQDIEVSLDDAQKALAMFRNRFPPGPFRLESVLDPQDGSVLILLKRLAPSLCPTCARTHENENPFLVVGGHYRDVYFDCRRAEAEQKLLIGSLGPAVVEFDPRRHQFLGDTIDVADQKTD